MSMRSGTVFFAEHGISVKLKSNSNSKIEFGLAHAAMSFSFNPRNASSSRVVAPRVVTPLGEMPNWSWWSCSPGGIFPGVLYPASWIGRISAYGVQRIFEPLEVLLRMLKYVDCPPSPLSPMSCLYDVMITMWVSSDISKYQCQGSVLLIGFLHI